jgi:hypothetical protein
MPSKSPSNALIQIAENLRLAREFVGNMSYDAFAEDRRTVYAVTRCFEIVSEASRRLPEEIRCVIPISHGGTSLRRATSSGTIMRMSARKSCGERSSRASSHCWKRLRWR